MAQKKGLLCLSGKLGSVDLWRRNFRGSKTGFGILGGCEAGLGDFGGTWVGFAGIHDACMTFSEECLEVFEGLETGFGSVL